MNQTNSASSHEDSSESVYYLPSDSGYFLETVYETSDTNTQLARYVPDFRTDERYQQLLYFIQRGAWQDAIPLLRALRTQYPHARELEIIMQDAMLRVQLESNWQSRVKGRRFNLPVSLLTRLIPILLIVCLSAAAIFWYGQNQAINASISSFQEMLMQAQNALQIGEYSEAAALFQKLLAENPQDEQLLRGFDEAQRQATLQQEYEAGVNAMLNREIDEAIELFQLIETRAPGYRDVPQLLSELEDSSRIERIFQAGELAYRTESWPRAIENYESLRSLDSTYEEETVSTNLLNAYLYAGQEIVAQRTEAETELEQAQEYFRKVLRLEQDQAEARTEDELLSNYIEGHNALTQGNTLQGVNQLRPIYEERPSYLGGYMEEQLRDGYMQLGDEARRSGAYREALTYYTLAASINIDGQDVAEDRARAVALLLTPTPTPTSTPTMTPTPVPPTSTPRPTPVPPTATPVPLTLADFSGWIAFRTDRPGGVWVMRSDGSDAQPAPAGTQQLFNELYEKQRWSPDGNAYLLVTEPSDVASPSVNIYKRRVDLPEGWRNQFALTDFSGVEYDPVWSPNNQYIAFVSNETGGDEIWTMSPEGENHKRLTFNDWPWDKHPTISGDGSQIAFYSNRTGKRQIWVMNADGSGQINISDGEYEEYDPVWLR